MIPETLVKVSIDLFKTKFIRGKNELLQIFDNGLEEYLENYKRKFVEYKNILYRSTPVNFFEVYHKVNFTNDTGLLEYENSTDFFRKNKKAAIFGSAGSGKSTFSKYIFLNTIQEGLFIPILIELREFNNYPHDFLNFIYDKIYNKKLLKI